MRMFETYCSSYSDSDIHRGVQALCIGFHLVILYKTRVTKNLQKKKKKNIYERDGNGKSSTPMKPGTDIND